MHFFILAMKNLLRYKRRTLLTSSTIFMATVCFVALNSLIRGAIEETERNLRDFEYSYAQVLNVDFFKDRDFSPIDKSFDPIPVGLALDKKGIKWTKRVQFRTEATVYQDPYPEDGNISLIGYGIDLEKDGEIYDLKKYLKEGEYLGPNDVGGVLIGSGLAEKLGAKVGYPILFEMKTRYFQNQTIQATIKGIIETPNPMINKYSVYFPLGEIDTYLQMEGQVNSVDIKIGGFFWERALNKILAPGQLPLPPGLSIYSWSVLGDNAFGPSKIHRIVQYIILFFLSLMALVGVSSTMLMSVSERFVEIGVLRALGMKNREVLSIFLFEGLGVAFIGFIAGLIVSFGVVYYLVNVGIDISGASNIDYGYRISKFIHGTWNLSAMVLVGVVSSVISVVSTYIPVRKALKASVIQCIREEV